MNFLSLENMSPDLNKVTIAQLHNLGFMSAGNNFLPTELFDISVFTSLKGISLLLIGGFLVGFGARYAGGCTSGHAITGIANLNWPSLVATVFFFVGGLAVTWGLGQLIFSS